MELRLQWLGEGVGSVIGCWKGVAGQREESTDEQGLQVGVGVSIKWLKFSRVTVRARVGV